MPEPSIPIPPSTGINEHRTVQIEIVTPVHIGAASEKLLLKGTDFFYYKKNLYLINFNALLEAVAQKGVNMQTISGLLAKGKAHELQKYLFETLKIEPESISYKVVENFGKDPGNEIRPFIRNGEGRPYIPGSSIKGALRSIFFSYLNETITEKTVNRTTYDRRLRRNVEQTEKVKEGDLENFLLGRFDESIMRYVRVYDAYFGEADLNVCAIDLFNLYSDGKTWSSDWKDKFSLNVETLYNQSITEFRLSLSKPLVEIIKNKYHKAEILPIHINHILPEKPFEHLRQLINNHTRAHLKRELDFFNKYNDAADSDLIIEGLENLLKRTESKDSCLLRMGYGAGFHGITGDWRFKDHSITVLNPDDKNWVWSQTLKSKVPARYKSRRVSGTDLMGFVQLTF